MDALPIEAMLENLKVVYEDTMPFNKYLGLKIESISTESVVVRIDMRDELVGNFEKKILQRIVLPKQD